MDERSNVVVPLRSRAQKRKRQVRRPNGVSFIYFVRCQSFIKIGLARDISSRLHSLSTGCPWPIDLVAFMYGNVEQERLLHNRFRDLRHRNEWFREEGDLVLFLQAITVAGNDPLETFGIARHWCLERSSHLSADSVWSSCGRRLGLAHPSVPPG